jgi:bifunctional DNase/RNase
LKFEDLISKTASVQIHPTRPHVLYVGTEGDGVFKSTDGGETWFDVNQGLHLLVKGLALDPLSNMPMIILRDEEEKRSLPIWVGLFEANAIALELEKISTPRPMTHDLIKNILEALDARVQKVVVNDLRDNTFYAVLYLRLGNADITVDSRPSDAIALALRVGAPIFVEEDVVDKARTVEVAKETEIGTGKGDDQAKIKEWLESLKPGDFDRLERDKDPKRPDE